MKLYFTSNSHKEKKKCREFITLRAKQSSNSYLRALIKSSFLIGDMDQQLFKISVSAVCIRECKRELETISMIQDSKKIKETLYKQFKEGGQHPHVSFLVKGFLWLLPPPGKSRLLNLQRDVPHRLPPAYLSSLITCQF